MDRTGARGKGVGGGEQKDRQLRQTLPWSTFAPIVQECRSFPLAFPVSSLLFRGSAHSLSTASLLTVRTTRNEIYSSDRYAPWLSLFLPFEHPLPWRRAVGENESRSAIARRNLLAFCLPCQSVSPPSFSFRTNEICNARRATSPTTDDPIPRKKFSKVSATRWLSIARSLFPTSSWQAERVLRIRVRRDSKKKVSKARCSAALTSTPRPARLHSMRFESK